MQMLPTKMHVPCSTKAKYIMYHKSIIYNQTTFYNQPNI